MTKKKRYSFDFPVDSVEAQWMEGQANRKAAISILIRKAVQRYGKADIIGVALNNMELFGNDDNNVNQRPAPTKPMINTSELSGAKSADSARPEIKHGSKEFDKSESKDAEEDETLELPNGLGRLSHR